MSKGTTHRTVRIEDGLWEAAKTKADADGVNLSEVIRAALRQYLDEGGTERSTALLDCQPCRCNSQGCRECTDD